MKYLQTVAGKNCCRGLSHNKKILPQSNRNTVRFFMQGALLCLLGSLIPQPRTSAQTVDASALPAKVISTIREKRGYAKAVAVRLASMRPAEVRGFLTAEITVKEGQETSQDSVSISSDGRFYTEAPVIALHSSTQSDILEALKTALGTRACSH